MESRGQEEEGRHGSTGDWTTEELRKEFREQCGQMQQPAMLGKKFKFGQHRIHQDSQIHNERSQPPKSNPEINQSNDFPTSEQAQL